MSPELPLLISFPNTRRAACQDFVASGLFQGRDVPAVIRNAAALSGDGTVKGHRAT